MGALVKLSGRARRLRGGYKWIFLVLAFFAYRAALHHCAWAPNQLVSVVKLVGARQVHGRSPGLLTRLTLLGWLAPPRPRQSWLEPRIRAPATPPPLLAVLYERARRPKGDWQDGSLHGH